MLRFKKIEKPATSLRGGAIAPTKQSLFRLLRSLRSLAMTVLLLATTQLLLTVPSFADTIITREGAELKGIVVEDYKDRLTFSTADGEITVMKADIAELTYDSEEDNLIKLAEQAQSRNDFITAYAYYDRAYKLNPESARARDGMTFLRGYLFRREEVRKEEEIKKREEFERSGFPIETVKTEEEALKEAADNMKKALGITVSYDGNFPKVETLMPRSAADEVGLRKGDLIVAIWGRLTGYMSPKEFMKVLLDKPSLEIKCTLERTVNVPRDLAGASLSMEFDGLTVSEVQDDSASASAGLKKDDLITAIEGKSTRYTPLKKAIDDIKNAKTENVNLTIRREVLMWRKDRS